MAHVTRKLSNSFEGALAGGGDPATSPLYVFGPFLRLIVIAGVASVTFGASLWLVVATIVMVSAMYRLVMIWVTDGSGGSGLSEEEFGGWAVKGNAAITFIEYTLTFLVSMAALVTFVADRAPVLNETFLGIQYRTFVAIILSIMTGWLVNRGPKTAARVFGPATAGVLLLLWAMIFATIWQFGFHLPQIDMRAFSPEYLRFTFGGFARMLAVMTGIEVFANLVAAYDGDAQAKSRKAFGSLLIIMGSTAVTMLIVGPAIHQLSDPTNGEVSVFTQTMDQLLPQPLAYAGTLIGIAVLLSAAAASAQGLQNLALGLKNRHYVPAIIGERNGFGVADKPVWIEVGLCCLAFVALGTNEETYLAIYAAGVFILLSMTGWAVTKRLGRQIREAFSWTRMALIVGTILAALLTTGATVIIFQERFFEGAWTYFLFIPLLYLVFTYFRHTLGDPSPLKEQLGLAEEGMWGVGEGSGAVVAGPSGSTIVMPAEIITRALPALHKGWQSTIAVPQRLLVTLDGSPFAEQVLPLARALCLTYDARLTLVSVLRARSSFQLLSTTQAQIEVGRVEKETYLEQVALRFSDNGFKVDYAVGAGPVAETINTLAHDLGADLIVMSTHGRSGAERWLIGSVASKVVQLSTTPMVLIRPSFNGEVLVSQFKKLLIPLDGSEFAERVLPYVRSIDPSFESEILLLTIPEVPEAVTYGVMAGAVEALRDEAEDRARTYLGNVAAALRDEDFNVRAIVAGSEPAAAITEISEKESVDLIMMATHGLGGLDRVFVGSVAERLVQHTDRPLFLLPIHEKRTPS
jgi:nucleotide-binding universal stress UspA family protein